MELILFFGYIIAGYFATEYLRYHLLGVRAEIYTNTGEHCVRKIILGCLIGWITIPIAILYGVIKSLFSSKSE